MMTRYQQALQAYAEGQYDQAMQQFSELLYEDPRNPKLHIWLGAAFRKAGKVEYARVQYQQVLTLTEDPDLLDLAKTSLEQMQSAGTASNGEATARYGAAVAVVEPPKEKQLQAEDDPDVTILAPRANGVAAEQAGRVPPPLVSATGSTMGAPRSAPVELGESAQLEGAVTAARASNGSASPLVSPSTSPAIAKTVARRPGNAPRREGILRLQSLKQKISGWAIALAGVPLVVVAGTAYMSSRSNIVEGVRQAQGMRAEELAKTLERYAAERAEEVTVLGKLLAGNLSAGKGGLPAPVRQGLANRLNLYAQAYPSFTSLTLFDANGNAIARTRATGAANKLGEEELKQVSEAKLPALSSPRQEGGEYVLHLTVPIENPRANRLEGLLRASMPLSRLTKALPALAEPGIYLIDRQGGYLTGGANVGTNAGADYPVLTQLLPQAAEVTMAQGKTADNNNRLLVLAPIAPPNELTGLDWAVLLSVDMEAALNANRALALAMAVAIGLSVAVVAAIARLLAQRVTSPIEMATEAVRRLGSGQLETRLPVVGKDELAELAASINAMAEQFQQILQQYRRDRERLQRQVGVMFRGLQKLAQVKADDVAISDESMGLLLRRVQANIAQKEAEVQRQRQEKERAEAQVERVVAEVKNLAHLLADGQPVIDPKDPAQAFEQAIATLRVVFEQLKASAHQVSHSLGQSEQAIVQLSEEALRQADDINRALNAMQLVATSAHTVADRAGKVVSILREGHGASESGGQAVDRAVKGMLSLRATVGAAAKKVKRLGETSQRISKIVALIDGIAVQTNFLSINASIEAARSGEEGRGFAIVAEEVGELAARAAAVSREIEQLVGGIQMEASEAIAAVETGTAQVAEGSQLVEDAKRSWLQIQEVSEQIDRLVQSVAESADSQVQTAESLTGLMKEISQIASRTANSSQLVSRSLRVAVQHADRVQQAIEQLQLEGANPPAQA